MYVECGKRFRCPDCQDTWTRCVLAKDHDGRCAWRLDTTEEVEHRGTWRRLVTPKVASR